jgi:hypothetical protein
MRQGYTLPWLKRGYSLVEKAAAGVAVLASSCV